MSQRSSAQWAAPGVITAVIVAGLCSWGMLRQGGSHFVGYAAVDGFGTQWFYWFVGHQLEHGEGLEQARWFFYPWGKDIFGHTGTNVLDALLAWPFRALFGPVWGYNLFVLTGFAATATALGVLGREVGAPRWAATVAGVLGAWSPYALFELVDGRPTQALLLLPALFCWALWRVGHVDGWRWPMLAGLLLGLVGYQYWYYALFFGFSALGLGLWWIATSPAADRLRLLGRLVLTAAVALLLTLPYAGPLLWSPEQEAPGLLRTDLWSMAANPTLTTEGVTIGLYTWQPLRHAAGFLVADESGEIFLPLVPLLPLVALPLWAVWVWRPGERGRSWWFAAVALPALIALGPVVMLGPWGLPNPVYVWLAQALGIVQRLWWSTRAFAVVQVWGTVVLALALAQVPRRFAVGAGATVAMAWAVDLVAMGLAPLPTWDATLPAGYQCLVDGEDQGAILELPWGGPAAHVYYQTVHERPMFGGMIEDNQVLTPERWRRLMRSNQLLVSLLEVTDPDRATTAELPARDWTAQEFRALGAVGYRYVVLQLDAYKEPLPLQARQWLTEVLGAPLYADARTVIFGPWGHALPCSSGSVRADQAPLGHLKGPDEAPWAAWLVGTPEEMAVERLRSP